jgi:hypothetical protein
MRGPDCDPSGAPLKVIVQNKRTNFWCIIEKLKLSIFLAFLKITNARIPHERSAPLHQIGPIGLRPALFCAKDLHIPKSKLTHKTITHRNVEIRPCHKRGSNLRPQISNSPKAQAPYTATLLWSTYPSSEASFQWSSSVLCNGPSWEETLSVFSPDDGSRSSIRNATFENNQRDGQCPK